MFPRTYFSDFFHSIYRGVVPQSEIIAMSTEPAGFLHVARYLGGLPVDLAECAFEYDGVRAAELDNPKNQDMKLEGSLVVGESRRPMEVSIKYPPTRVARCIGWMLHRDPNVAIVAKVTPPSEMGRFPKFSGDV